SHCSRVPGKCIRDGHVDCGGYGCPPGQKCASVAGKCVAENLVDCGNGRYCGPGQTCGTNGCIDKRQADPQPPPTTTPPVETKQVIELTPEIRLLNNQLEQFGRISIVNCNESSTAAVGSLSVRLQFKTEHRDRLADETFVLQQILMPVRQIAVYFCM